MAKKKATMTLKDFHGGSIPSDLPLPSAPGVTVRPLNHTGLDRNNAWTNPMGRQDHRLRPGSAGAVRTYDDKTPFLSHNVQIGRNFDEDERKPLDGGSLPRRTFSDDNIRGGVPVRPEVKVEYPVAGNMVTRPATTPVSQYGGSSYAARFSEGANVSGARPTVSGPSPNAWGPRKAAVDMVEPSHASWSAPDAATKLAHASALEKVTSGRWLSNQNKQIDVVVIRHPEPEAKVQLKGNSYTTFTHASTDVRDDAVARHAGRSMAVNDKVPVSARDVLSYTKERGPTVYNDGVQAQQVYIVGTVSGSEMHPSATSESTERPQLKLLPRTKPVETLEPLVAYNQTVLQSANPVVVDIGNASFKGPGLAGPEDAHQAYERPKVNLKPRTQPLEPMERNTETARNTLFGGARPRELVLKERGVDDVAVIQDMIQSPNRIKNEITRVENPGLASRQNGRTESLDHHRTGKNIDRRDTDKSDAQRRGNWRNENRKSSRDLEQQQPPQERPPSPETWRKPVEPEPPVGPRYGKAASAIQLAQAFSKSVSDPKLATDRFSSQRGLPGQGQIPFSRLTSGPPTRPYQINGH